MKKPTLMVLAAGMGSRYGGVKQIDAVGVHGETLLDFGVYDANKSGFGKVVFIIRKDIEKDLQKLTDDYIKEIYLYAAYARQAGQRKIPVYVFPFKMNDENMQKHVMENMENALLNFWRNLKSGYDLFFSGKKKLNIRVDREGHYLFL